MAQVIKIKNVILEIMQGDLLETEADVYVCPINTKLNLAYGIGEIIAKQAGDQYAEELKSKGDADIGTVVTTRAGGTLKAKYIFHGVVEDTDHEVPRDVVAQVLQHCFRLMDAMTLKTIAFPMLGSPKSKVPYDTFSRIMARTTFDYFTKNTSKSLHIKFVLYNKELLNSFIDQVNVLRQEFFI